MEKIKLEPKEFFEDKKWTFAHYSKLMQKYPNDWVAVVNKKIVSAGDDIKKVREEAMEKTGKKHIPLIFIEGDFSVLKN